MNTWTTQAGYPLVTVERQADKKTLIINQKRFILKNKNHNDATKWEIPLNYASPLNNNNFESTKHLFILNRNQNNIKVELQEETEWIVFNVQQTGKYILSLCHFYLLT